MAMTIRELKAYLADIKNEDEIIIGQLWTASDFAIEGDDGVEREPSQEVMAEVDRRFWKDGITQESWGWLSDVVHEVDNELRA